MTGSKKDIQHMIRRHSNEGMVRNINDDDDDHLVAAVPPSISGEEDNEWDAKGQPLTSLYHDMIISSPSHDDGDMEHKVPIVAGELIDFDEHVLQVMKGNKDLPNTTKDNDLDVSGLSHEMFEGAFEVDVKRHEDSVEVVSDEDDSLSKASAPSLKRPSVSLPMDGNGPAKKKASRKEPEEESPKKKKETPIPIVNLKTPPLPPLPAPRPGRRRPMCMFVNHFGTRMTSEGRAVPVSVSVEASIEAESKKSPARISGSSSEESVSIRTKHTNSSKNSSSSCHYSTSTPMKAIHSAGPMDWESPDKIPTTIRIVTPTTVKPMADLLLPPRKPVSSACIDDIHMEEDDYEPIHPQSLHFNEDKLMESPDLPFIKSLVEDDEESVAAVKSTSDSEGPSTPSSGSPTQSSSKTPIDLSTDEDYGPSHPNYIPPTYGGGMMPCMSGSGVNFNRPFPMLQRRAFLNGCHPMAAASAYMAGAQPWPGYVMPAYPMMPTPFSMAAPPLTTAAKRGDGDDAEDADKPTQWAAM